MVHVPRCPVQGHLPLDMPGVLARLGDSKYSEINITIIVVVIIVVVAISKYFDAE